MGNCCTQREKVDFNVTHTPSTSPQKKSDMFLEEEYEKTYQGETTVGNDTDRILSNKSTSKRF